MGQMKDTYSGKHLFFPSSLVGHELNTGKCVCVYLCNFSCFFADKKREQPQELDEQFKRTNNHIYQQQQEQN